MLAWQTSTVLTLMAGVDADGAWDRLPILADALQDAGYPDDEVLAYLREPGDEVGPWYRRVVEGVVTLDQVTAAVAYLADFGLNFRHSEWADPPDDLEGEDLDAWYDDESNARHLDDGLSVSQVLDMCETYVETGEREGFGVETSGIDVGDMWEQYAVLTGTPPPVRTGTSWEGKEFTYLPQPFECAC